MRSYSEYRDFGKAMIAREVLSKECDAISAITKMKSADRKHWIATLFATLINKAKHPSDLKLISENLTIVTFNYDLLFEYCLDEFCQGDGEWGDALKEFKKNLKIIHIYGKLGKFEWESEAHLAKIYDSETLKSFKVRDDKQQFGFAGFRQS